MFGGALRKFIDGVNSGVTSLADSPRFGGLVSGYITSISYVVSLPDRKAWWRNFLGTGAPLSITLDGAPRTAHAVAVRDERGRVTVTAHLNG